MPGPPSEFSDKTVIFIYGEGNIGKTTFSSFLYKKLPSIYLSIDYICSVVYNNNKKLIEEFIIKDLPITSQLWKLNKSCEKNQIIVNSTIMAVTKEIETRFNGSPDIKLMIIEGHGLHAMSDVLEGAIAYCVKNKIRYWRCHK